MTAFYEARGITRATIGDEFYGPSCPKCSNPKDNQALECRECYLARMRDEAFWARRTCACGAPKYQYSARCNACKYERQRTVGVLSGEIGVSELTGADLSLLELVQDEPVAPLTIHDTGVLRAA